MTAPRRSVLAQGLQVAAIFLGVLVLEETAAQNTGMQQGRAAQISAPDVVAALALKGVSGGMVARSIAPRQRVIGESEFDSWVRDMRRGVSDLRALGARYAAPDQFVAEFVRQDLEKNWRAQQLPSGIHVLRDGRAVACEAALKRHLKEPVRGQNVLRLITSAVSKATGAKTPGGFVGSCIGVGQDSDAFVDIPGSYTLEEALNGVVGQFEGVAWVAVQGNAGDCSLGIVQQSAAADKLCVVTLARNISQK